MMAPRFWLTIMSLWEEAAITGSLSITRHLSAGNCRSVSMPETIASIWNRGAMKPKRTSRAEKEPEVDQPDRFSSSGRWLRGW
jgi:hypothetical protein